MAGSPSPSGLDILGEDYLLDRPYTQAFFLCFGELLPQNPRKTPFYYGPIQQFEARMRTAKLVPPAPAVMGTFGLMEKITG